jgi:alpha-tubulin suppressor-like RCC1 family protein
MSDVSVDIIKNRSGEAPDLPSGANLSGVSTAATLQVTNLNPTHINASGVTTATTFSGSLKSTGTPTLGLGVTINSSGLNISGVATAGIVSATTLYGDGSNLTGVAISIAPISYQPDVNDTLVTRASSGVSIGMTFTQRVIAGSGNITLRIAGAAGTVVENFGVGSSVTISNNEVSVTPTAALLNDTVYHISYPSGAFTNTAGDVSYVGTAYTFTAAPTQYQLWSWGDNDKGSLGHNNRTHYSSPVQVPSTSWLKINKSFPNETNSVSAGKDDGTLWTWGDNEYGDLGLNDIVMRSSPTQIPGTTWDTAAQTRSKAWIATKTDGTLWVWGRGYYGQTGLNNNISYSSPVQIGSSTDWATGRFKIAGDSPSAARAIKTDGTLWAWGYNNNGTLGQNQATAQLGQISSPVQIPGTTWKSVGGSNVSFGIKTDGTLWGWGGTWSGSLGLNVGGPGYASSRSSPTQIPGTTWENIAGGVNCTMATKTDGTLWAWGVNDNGNLGLNNRTKYSSPTQIPGTNWDTDNFTVGERTSFALKTDGTLWSWGYNYRGPLGQNTSSTNVLYSSPVQIPGTTWSYTTSFNVFGAAALKQI